jgi:glycosyltransferase involved in cell wall biosynthesis
MRVLHVIPSLSAVHGGPTRALALMEHALTRQGVTVETAATDDEGPGRRNRKQLGLPVAENGVVHHFFAKRMEFYTASPGFARWIFRNAGRYDLLHIHALFSFTTTVAAWAARRAGVPYVLRPLGTLTHYGVTQRRPWLKQLSLAVLEGPALKHAAAVHFTSEAERDEAAQWQIPMRGVVVPLGIDVPDSAGDPLARQRLGLGSTAGQPYLLYLSRLDRKKNVEGLLHAFHLCASQLPGVKLVLAGDGEPGYVSGLKELAFSIGIAERVIWAGHVEGALKASLLSGAALFVLPSFSENFGIAAAEALMAGKPCVLGNGVAIAQEVASAGAGLAVAPDAASVAAALLQVMGDAPARERMALKAAALARSHFSVDAMGHKLKCLYEDILNR